MHCFSILKLALYVRLQERPILCSEHITVHYNVHNTVHKTCSEHNTVRCSEQSFWSWCLCIDLKWKAGHSFFYFVFVVVVFLILLYFVFVLFCVDLKWKEMHTFLRNNVMEIKCNHIAQRCIHWNKYYCNNGTQYNRLIGMLKDNIIAM